MHEPTAALAYNPSFCLPEDAFEHPFPDGALEPAAFLAYDPTFCLAQSSGALVDLPHIAS